MTKFLLHIGLPKTGTKYLQTHFRRLRSELADRGVDYPAEWWRDETEVNHDYVADQIRSGDTRGLQSSFDRLRESGRTVMISCEGLSGFGPTEIKRLRALLGRDHATVVLFCRRWSDWIPSAWQQTVKQGSGITFPEYIADTFQKSQSITAINFGLALDRYAAIAGSENVRLVSYSNIVDDGADIFTHFVRHILDWQDPPPAQGEQIHESMGVVTTELVRVLNMLRSRSGQVAGIPVVRSLQKLQRSDGAQDSLRRLTDQMASYLTEITISDEAPGLRELYHGLNARYSSFLVPKGEGQMIFAPRTSQVKFVHQDYLADPLASSAIQWLASEVGKLLERPDQVMSDRPALREIVQRPVIRGTILIRSGGAALDYMGTHPAFCRDRASGVHVLHDVEFGTGAAGQQFLGFGWSRPEAKFVWSDGVSSELTLPAADLRADSTLLLVVRPFVRDTRLPTQRADVSVNGSELGGVEVGTFSVLELQLPAALIADHGGFAFRFSFPNAARPADFGDSIDQRQLAICLERAILVQRQDAQDEGQQVVRPALVASGPEHPPASIDPALFTRFESLGENCEFGLVQRRAGVEPLGLLRFSSTPFPPLLRALRARFAGLGEAGSLVVEVAASGREYMVTDRSYGFRYHAWVKLGEMEPQAILLREQRRVPFLVEKLIQDLTEGEKVFVFHGMQPLAEAEARDLAAAVAGFGPGTLLWVELADAAHPPGSVVRLGPNLLKGHMDRFAPAEDAHDLSFACWLTLCRNALEAALAREAA